MEHPDSFRSSFRTLLILGQVCGLLPLKGIYNSKITFSWKNPVHIYGLLITGIAAFFDYCCTADNFKSKFGIDVFASTVFYTVCLLTSFLFLRIAIEFPQISAHFEAVEAQMADYGYPTRLSLKIRLFIYIFLLLAVVEHGTLVCINIVDVWNRSTKTGEPMAPLFYTHRFESVEARVPYSMFWLLVFFGANIVCTFNWSYPDFFLICISMQISERFAQINARLKRIPLEQVNSTFFAKICMDYNNLSLLTKQLDKKFGNIILTSCFSNLYHLSLQLARSLKLEGNFFLRMYFYFSLFYLTSRLLLVLLFASKIHLESKKPAQILLSTAELPPEAARFLHQVLTDNVAFTGNKFFIINRKLLMSVVGTILTYQAFLLQFNSLNQEIRVEFHDKENRGSHLELLLDGAQ